MSLPRALDLWSLGSWLAALEEQSTAHQALCTLRTPFGVLWQGGVLWGSGGSRVLTPQAQAAVSLPRALDFRTLGSMLAALDERSAAHRGLCTLRTSLGVLWQCGVL